MRGLKLFIFVNFAKDYQVAPYVGAWIETEEEVELFELWQVAPYVGAWIETSSEQNKEVVKESHPTWVRGLKPE